MKIYYREKSGGIEILRCLGIESRVEIPEMIDEKMVISAAPYAFSSHMDETEELKDASVWEMEDGFGFGREERVLAGNEVEEIVFPDSLREIGRYIFYGCGNLKKLEFSDSLMQIGCGAFTGCHALEKLTVHMKQGKKSGVKEMLGEMWQRIDVTFLYEDKNEQTVPERRLAGDMFETGKVHRKDSKCEARLVFPEHYDEAVENTPARILYTEYHGSGSNYRQCFYNKELNYQEYDKLFEMAVVMDKLEVLVNMSFGRLEFPYELTEKAREEYQGYIKKNLREIAVYLVKQEDIHRLEVISVQKLWTLEGIDAALDCASQRKETEVSAFLMNERANLVDKSVGDKRVSVDKIKNHQEMNMPVLEKTVHASPAEKPLSMRKKRFEL
ncbi:leucine-rich repeat domain-containing protein [Ruminococcus sp. AF21-42]|nr:leucine-rich repeat domain-containing protein [Ruminococcus sp. AF21-42]